AAVLGGRWGTGWTRTTAHPARGWLEVLWLYWLAWTETVEARTAHWPTWACVLAAGAMGLVVGRRGYSGMFFPMHLFFSPPLPHVFLVKYITLSDKCAMGGLGTEESLLVLRNLGIQTRTASAASLTLFPVPWG